VKGSTSGVLGPTFSTTKATGSAKAGLPNNKKARRAKPETDHCVTTFICRILCKIPARYESNNSQFSIACYGVTMKALKWSFALCHRSNTSSNFTLVFSGDEEELPTKATY